MCFNVHIVQARQGDHHGAGHAGRGGPQDVGAGHALLVDLGAARLQGRAGHAPRGAEVNVSIHVCVVVICYTVQVAHSLGVGAGHARQVGQEAGHARPGDPHVVGEGHALHGGLGLARLQGEVGHALQVARVGVPFGM